MNEQLFYIEENIEGVWDNERYSLTINHKDINNQRVLYLVNKENDQNSSVEFIGYIGKKEENFYCILTIVTIGHSPNTAKEYKINLDASIGQLILYIDGANWVFKKVL